MKKILFSAMMIAGVILVSNSNAAAQDTNTDNHTIAITIPEVAILDLEATAGKNITMNFTAPTEAGLPIVAASNNSAIWLNYSSIKSVVDATRKVSVKIDAAIAGVTLKVTAAAYAGNGAGTTGTPSTQLTLTATEQDIISGIGSAYTGTGISNGHQLTYNLTAEDANYANLSASANTVIVTYTISDN